jgi:signal transduction histidine kinase
MLIAIPEHVILKDTIAVYDKIMIITAIFALVATLMGYLLIRMSIVKPLQSITEQVQAIELDQDVEIKLNDKSEIGLLAESFNMGMKELNTAREKERRNEALLMQQSKMAAMGEMLDAVAHQWKQPLNALSMYAELIKIDYEDGEVDQAYIEQFQEDIETQINHMTDTLGTFRTFFRPTKELHAFELHQVIDDVLLLAKDELTKNTINVEVIEEGKLELFGSENEFKHLLLNIINNAKDAFNDNGIKNRNITIRIITDDKKSRLEIEDSAGGIPESVIENVFKAHFTTKEEGKGTGIGLYMSSQIAQKHHAELRVENREKGACFIVDFSELSFHS